MASVQAATPIDQATAERLSARFNRVFETFEAGGDLFTPDAFFDLNMPVWRFQLQGPENFAAQIERMVWIIRLVSLFRTDPEQVRPVLGVERAYLEAAFAEIEAQYGGFEAYRREALGLDDAETAAFRRLALE